MRKSMPDNICGGLTVKRHEVSRTKNSRRRFFKRNTQRYHKQRQPSIRYDSKSCKTRDHKNSHKKSALLRKSSKHTTKKSICGKSKTLEWKSPRTQRGNLKKNTQKKSITKSQTYMDQTSHPWKGDLIKSGQIGTTKYVNLLFQILVQKKHPIKPDRTAPLLSFCP